MRCVIKIFGQDRKLEFPDSWQVVAEPAIVKTSEGEMSVYSVRVLDPKGQTRAAFGGVMEFYPESFIPPKQEFVNDVKIPKKLSWLGDAA